MSLSDNCLMNKHLKRKGNSTTKLECSISVQKGVNLGVLTKQEWEALIPQASVNPVFYHLPKTHKGLDSFINRPIIAGTGSLNEHMGLWIDYQLQLLVRELPSYLRDTKQLLNIC